jgi:hypothetical protein
VKSIIVLVLGRDTIKLVIGKLAIGISLVHTMVDAKVDISFGV